MFYCMFLDCCMLLVVSCKLFGLHYSLCLVCRLLFVVRCSCLLFVVRCALLVELCLLFVVCCFKFVVRCVLFVACDSLCVVRGLLFVACCLPFGVLFVLCCLMFVGRCALFVEFCVFGCCVVCCLRALV